MTHAAPTRFQHNRPISHTPHDLLRTAQHYVEAGLSIIPVGVNGNYAKQPHYEALKKTDHCYWDDGRRKWVATWMAFRERLPTQSELHDWFITHGAQGMAMVTGEISGLVALDFDKGAGVKAMHRLGIEPHVRSASGGYHAYVRHPGWPVATTNSNSKQSLPAGVDVRGDGGLVVLPPTVTDVGRYERLSTKKLVNRLAIPEVVELAGQTYRLRELLGLERAPEVTQDEPRVAARAPIFSDPSQEDAERVRVDYLVLVERALSLTGSRGRNDAGFWLACQLRDNGFALSEALEVGPYWLSLLPMTNTKGEREAYVLAHFEASVRSAFRRVPVGRGSTPWVKGFGR
ncbi:bifunctional DNA primase/polymerase [Deinococcus peraridilitoris]|uniref:Bifunctional DNA primase/polymerase famiily protein n=1 Tax=Deinococcus peraridilitoris (strain DSM 19664 / LMG 22246 / CIP 109416 / KR-200) TaxID=937777 RepID=L0A7C8_DEIPD|nr:bifunctional DNA primase/polymerase [Deinococcus peraridilitoris]AFZ69768.1 bifunctional DNA primase/polymerase famiily protein [Deinococcus peraridilitoris DSM 19664]